MCSAKLPNSMNYCLACGNHPEPEPVYVMKVYSTRKTWRSEATCLTWLATLLATGNMSSQTRCDCARLEEEQFGRITSTSPTVRDTKTGAEIQPGPYQLHQSIKRVRNGDLDNLKELVEFFSRVLDRKKEKNWDDDAKSLYSRAARSSCSMKQPDSQIFLRIIHFIYDI